MNWKAIGTVLLNLGLSFAAAYGAALGTGLSGKAAVGAGLVGVGLNQAGLHQPAPGSAA